MTDAHLWDKMRPGLAAFASCHFADLAQDDSFAAMAARALAAAPERFALLGFSMGAYVAREMVRQAPERVTRLVQIGTSARPNTAEFDRRNKAAAQRAQEDGFKGLSRGAIRYSLHPDNQDDPALFDFIQAMAQRMGRQAFINQLLVARRDERPELGGIRCPALVVWSRQDKLRTLEESRELADGIAGAKLRIIEDCGHMIPLERPDALTALLKEWLAP